MLLVQSTVASSSDYSLGLESLTYFFVVLAAILPASIAAYSIVGEKVEKSLEPLLATPDDRRRDPPRKEHRGVRAAYPRDVGRSFNLHGGVRLHTVHSGFSYYYFPNWTAGVMLLLLAPLAAIFSIELTVIVSSRVNDVRSANQIGVLMFIPFMAVFLAGAEGIFAFSVVNLLIFSGIVLIADAVLFFLSTSTFRREEILTKWK